MALSATACRRWFGAVVLGAALAMLVAGQTVLRDRLSVLGFLVYWLVCLMLTGTAMLVALLDAWVVRRQSRERKRDLLKAALQEIEDEARARRRRVAPRNRPGPRE